MIAKSVRWNEEMILTSFEMIVSSNLFVFAYEVNREGREILMSWNVLDMITCELRVVERNKNSYKCEKKLRGVQGGNLDM